MLRTGLQPKKSLLTLIFFIRTLSPSPFDMIRQAHQPISSTAQGPPNLLPLGEGSFSGSNASALESLCDASRHSFFQIFKMAKSI